MYSNLKSDEKRRQEVISCLYWSLMQNWNIPQSMQDYFGLTEDYRLYHQLEDMDPAMYRQKRAIDLTECGPLEKGMASHFSILALRTP